MHPYFLYEKEETIMADEFSYEIVDELDYPFEEAGNQFSAFRKIRWGSKDSSYLELRRWKNLDDGSELPMKGMTFLTEEGPSELAELLVRLGYGNTKKILDNIKDRDDFRRSLNSVLGSNDEAYDESAGTLEDDFYDPKSLIEE